MKLISTSSNGKSKRKKITEEATPAESTIQFLSQFARCYHVADDLSQLSKSVIVLN
ncbi:MAG: hypothetical protein QM654_05400 [Dysgonamonadaceae bacterium]